jgi:hypothetical protein
MQATRRPRFFRFTYYVSGGRHDRDLLPHQLRDGDAALFLHQALHERGFDYAGPLFNYPCAQPAAAGNVPVDDSLLRADDLLLLTTRPPMDDDDDAVKCRVHRSHTTLEAKVFACMRRHLPRCSRSQVTVADVHARAFPEVAAMRNVLFQQKRGARIHRYLPSGSSSWQQPPGGRARTLAYLIYEEHAWPDGPALLAAFGMCGTDTLLWNYFLATRFSDLIGSVPFAMAELAAPDKASSRSLSIGFAHDWQVRLLSTNSPAGSERPVAGGKGGFRGKTWFRSDAPA